MNTHANRNASQSRSTARSNAFRGIQVMRVILGIGAIGMVAMLAACGSVRGTDKPLLQETPSVQTAQPANAPELKTP
jgi:hypothetical protein